MARILVAEDDETLRSFLARSLKRAGYEVVSVGDGTEAVLWLKEERFDLLIADIVMPEMDGVELARRAAVISPGIKVIYLTGFAGVASRHSDRSSSSTVLSKPFHLKQLTAEVEKTLRSD